MIPAGMSLPEKIGRYRVDRVLGEGSMGVIYQAHDPVLDRHVAIKLIRAHLLQGEQKVDFIARFQREAQTAGRCTHPNIVAVYDLATHEGSPYLAMELVNGISLDAALKQKGRFPPAEAVPVMLQVLDALHCAHRIGVVHRDVKPANILLMAGNEVKITDFGIARFDTSELTHHGALIGTPSYMSPEQCRGEAVDARSDLFSAGGVLFEMLTGTRPFPGRTTTEIAYHVLNDELPRPAEGIVPANLAAVLKRAMAKRAADRFTSARDMADAVRAAAEPDATVVTTRRTTPQISLLEAERAEQALARYIGPIARVLVSRALRQASSPAALWEMLAEEIGSDAERTAFLRRRPGGL